MTCACKSSSTNLTHSISAGAIDCGVTGTWSWGDTAIWAYTPEQDNDIKEAWNYCSDNGLVFYDTAQVYGYGESERIIGRLLKSLPEEKRGDIIIASKCEY